MIGNSADAIYVLATEELVGQPGGGLGVSDAAFDATATAREAALPDDEVERVLVGALAGPQASAVAATMTQAAEAALPDEVWDRVIVLNPDLLQSDAELAPPDTELAPPDTELAPPDTELAPPDTELAPPATG